jgi:hypothetical protein
MSRRRLVVTVVALVVAVAGPAAALTAHLITATSGSGSLLNKTPGMDHRIGTMDDGTETGAWGGGSDFQNNAYGAASFALVNASPGAAIPSWPEPHFSNIMFVDGTIEFTPDYNASTASDLVLGITGGSLHNTVEFGYDASTPNSPGEVTTTDLSGVAHFDPTDGSGSIVLSGNFTRSDTNFLPLNLLSQTLTAEPGKAAIVLAAQFGSSGNTYVDTVLVPLVPATATAIVLVEFTGRVVGTTSNGWASHGVLATYTTDDLGCAVFGMLPCTATTTTTLPGGDCDSFAACEPFLAAALPNPKSAPRKGKGTARKLKKLEKKAARFYGKGGKASGKKQTRFYKKSCNALRSLGNVAGKAAGKSRLGVPLDAITGTLERVRAFIPGCA